MSAPLPRKLPSEVGYDPRRIEAFYTALAESGQELHSFALLRDGAVISEETWYPYRADDVHILNSLSKSFTSTAVGFAVDEGHLTIDDYVAKFFPNELPDVISENLSKVKIRHLLSMSVGHGEDSTGRFGEATDGNWAKAFLACAVDHEPGTHFVYNSGATYMLAVIVERLTGEKLPEYLRSRLFDPIGIETITWDTCPRGHTVGGWGMSINIDAIVRFGWLYLQQGVWEGKRVVPKGWVSLATSKQVENGSDPNNDWNYGYGFQFWRSQHGNYRADGAFGQFCVVVPGQNMVIATTGCVDDLQKVLNLFWDHLVLPGEPGDAKDESFDLPGPSGTRTSPIEESLQGRVFEVQSPTEKIRTISFDAGSLMLGFADREETLSLGLNHWARSETKLWSASPTPVALRSAWKDENTLVSRVQYLLSPSRTVYTFSFSENQVEVTQESFGRLWANIPGPFTAVIVEQEGE